MLNSTTESWTHAKLAYLPSPPPPPPHVVAVAAAVAVAAVVVTEKERKEAAKERRTHRLKQGAESRHRSLYWALILLDLSNYA